MGRLIAYGAAVASVVLLSLIYAVLVAGGASGPNAGSRRRHAVSVPSTGGRAIM